MSWFSGSVNSVGQTNYLPLIVEREGLWLRRSTLPTQLIADTTYVKPTDVQINYQNNMGYDDATGTYTVNVSGFYYISVTVVMDNVAALTVVGCRVVNNASTASILESYDSLPPPAATPALRSFSFAVYMPESFQFWIDVYQKSGAAEELRGLDIVIKRLP